MQYEEACAYLDGLQSFGCKPGLHRIQALLKALGNPEKAYKTIHITGTNGKGSVTSLLYEGICRCGLSCASFTSPHLFTHNERMRVDGEEISPEDFAKTTALVKDAVEDLVAQGMEHPTMFEIATAMAFLYYAMRQVDYAVIEVGLGGTLDSTNVLEPVLTAITNVAFDHQDYCGHTLEEIAAHKAGIIKEGIPLVTAAKEPALSVIRDRAQVLSAPIYVLGESMEILSRHREGICQRVTLRFLPSGEEESFPTTLLGAHQGENLACAAMAMKILVDQDERLQSSLMKEAFAHTRWPGRFEICQVQGRTVIFDGAHNPAGARAFAQTYEEVFGKQKKTVVIALLTDKDFEGIIPQLIHEGDSVIAVPAPTPRSWVVEELAQAISPEATYAHSVKEGMDKALAMTEPGDCIAVCGSLYILGEARQVLSL